MFFQINNVLCRFFLSFDQKDWTSMTECLADEVSIDYSSSGREQPSSMKGQEFVARRRNAVDRLTKNHSFSNLLIDTGPNENTVTARCNYLILRFDLSMPSTGSGDNHFHSCGNYEFMFCETQGEWKIAGIKQNALQSWGNPLLHGGSQGNLK